METNRSHSPHDEEARRITAAGFAMLTAFTRWLLRFSMAHRWVIVALCAFVFLSIVPLFMFVGKNFLPVDDQSQFEVSVRAPEGYSLSASSQLMERIATDIRKMPGVTDTLVTVGGGQAAGGERRVDLRQTDEHRR